MICVLLIIVLFAFPHTTKITVNVIPKDCKILCLGIFCDLFNLIAEPVFSIWWASYAVIIFFQIIFIFIVDDQNKRMVMHMGILIDTGISCQKSVY